jgi:hypothetical protein
MPVSKDFRVRNGLVIGSSGTGNICAGTGLFTTSLSSAALSGDGRAITTTAAVSLSGDVGGYVSLDNLTGEKTITATIQANSVALGTDTTGDYVQSLALNTTTPTLTGTSLAAAEGNTITGLGLSATGVTATSYGSTTAIPVLTILEDGRISSASTSTVATTLSTTGDAGTGDVSLLTQGLTIAGTSNEIETSASNQTVTIGLPDDVTIAGNLTVNGTCTLLNQAVTATTTATENNFVIRSTDDGASASPDLKLWRDSSDPDDNDEIGNIFFTGTNSASEATNYAHILGQITDVTDGTEDGRLTFKTMAAGTLSDRLTINSGLVGIGTTVPNEELTVSGTLSASTSVVSPIVNGTTCVESPIVCGTTKVCSPWVAGSACVTSPLVCGTTSVNTPIIYGSSCVCSPTLSGTNICGTTLICGATICGTTAVCAPTICAGTSFLAPTLSATTICGDTLRVGGGYGSTGISIGSDGTSCLDGTVSIGTTATNACLTVAGTVSASGIVYADAFNSATGGDAISFNDSVTLTGTLSATDDIVHVGDPDTKISFTTDNIAICAGSCNLIRIDGTNNIVGIGTVSTASPSVPTVVQFNNDTTAYRSASATITNGASAALLCFPYADYRTGKIVVQAVGIGGSSGHIESSELLITHDGSETYSTEYGLIRTGDDIGTYTTVLAGSNLEVRATNGLGASACFVASIQHLMA